MKVTLKICGGCNIPKPIWKNHGGVRYCKDCWMKKQKELTLSGSEAKPTNQPYKKRIPARSSRRSQQESEYSKERLIFLDENPICKMKIPGLCTIKATTVQHLKGRIGDLLLNKEFWLPACWPCHSYADTHPAEAIENGWALPRLP